MRRAVAIACCLALAGAIAGCGNASDDPVTLAETEGIYLELGELKYQIQMSRILNAGEVEDKAYLVGLPEFVPEPTAKETWFGVFLRVENDGDEPRTPSDDFTIVDTSEKTFKPVAIRSELNPFAYEPIELQPRGLIPEPDSPAADGPIQGSLVLFKLPYSSLGNRPLEFKIGPAEGSDGATGIVDLDV